MKSAAELLKSPEIIKENLFSVYEQASEAQYEEGMGWYKSAHSFALELSGQNNISLMRVCGIISALSPRKLWSENMKLAKKYLKGQNASHTKVQLNKCSDIYNSGSFSEILHILGGMKTKSFFVNLLYPEDSQYVTLDRHAISAALGFICEDITRNQYNILKEIYKQCAKETGIIPSEFQAICWLSWKTLKKENKNGENTYNKAEIVYF